MQLKLIKQSIIPCNGENANGLVANMLDYDIIVSEFELQSRYYIHFETHTLRRGMRPFILPTMYLRGYSRGIKVKELNCGIVVREFELQSLYYVHFRTNTIGKSMNPLILPAMG